jgi:flagellar hook-associated protein 1 FlgK
VERILDQYRVDSLRTNVSEEARLGAFNDLAGGIDGLLASPDSGLSQPLQDFFAALQTVADNPSSVSARHVALSQANVLSDRFTTLDTRLTDQNNQINARLSQAVTQVNALAESVADLNLAIRDAQAAAAGAPPNDLLDQRDLVLQQLSEQIAIDVVDQADGGVSVFVGNGQSLVLDGNANQLVLAQSEFPSANPEVAMLTATGTTMRLSQVSGGEIGGLLDFRREMLDPTRNTLGQLAIGLTETMNTQHQAGMDLDGNLGGDLFRVGAPSVTPSTGNTGGGDVSVQVASASGLTTSDYLLAYDGGSYSLTRLDTGAAVPLSGSGTALDPFVADGLNLIVNTAPAAGDSFLIRPTSAAAGDFGVTLADPRGIAAAVPIVSAAELANTGSGSISGDRVTDPTNPALLDPVTFEFLDASSYSINGAGSFPYSADVPITVNGWEVSISGAPAAGDQFTVTSNAGGVGDNRNALALSDAFDGGFFSGGTVSVQARFESLVSQVATDTRRSSISLTAQTAITEQARIEQLSVSGVNLDEEAANMIKYQQAYQATAQMIGVADALFQTLLSMTRN